MRWLSQFMDQADSYLLDHPETIVIILLLAFLVVTELSLRYQK